MILVIAPDWLLFTARFFSIVIELGQLLVLS